MTVVAVLALAVVGTGAAFAYRTFVGSPRSGEPPIIKADNSPTKVVPAPSDGAAQDPGPHGAWRRQRKARSARRNPGRRQCEVRRSARGVSAAEPEQQSAAGSECCSGWPGAGYRANGTMPNNEPRKIKTLAVKGDAAENGGIPAGATAPPPKPAPATRSAATPARLPLPAAAPVAPAAAPVAQAAPPAARNPASANASANAPLSLTPQGGADRRRPPRGSRPSIPRKPPPRPMAADIWFRSPRRRTRPTRRPPTGRCRASSRPCWVRGRR